MAGTNVFVFGKNVIGTVSDTKRAFANVAASQTDSSLVAAVTGKNLLILAVIASTGATATAFTFNSKPAGAGTAISPLITNAINSSTVLQLNPAGWFMTNSGEGFTVTTGAGSSTGFQIVYAEVEPL